VQLVDSLLVALNHNLYSCTLSTFPEFCNYFIIIISLTSNNVYICDTKVVLLVNHVRKGFHVIIFFSCCKF
jgi:hypothetical protein